MPTKKKSDQDDQQETKFDEQLAWTDNDDEDGHAHIARPQEDSENPEANP